MPGIVTMVDAGSLPVGAAGNPLVVGSGAGVVSATITSGTALTAAIDLGATQRLGRLVIPSGWTAANLTFQTSPDGVTYTELYVATDAAGTTQVYTIGVPVTTGCSVLVSLADFASIRYLKVRSGTSGTPVNQGADRVLSLVTRTVA